MSPQNLPLADIDSLITLNVFTTLFTLSGSLSVVPLEPEIFIYLETLNRNGYIGANQHPQGWDRGYNISTQFYNMPWSYRGCFNNLHNIVCWLPMWALSLFTLSILVLQ